MALLWLLLLLRKHPFLIFWCYFLSISLSILFDISLDWWYSFSLFKRRWFAWKLLMVMMAMIFIFFWCFVWYSLWFCYNYIFLHTRCWRFVFISITKLLLLMSPFEKTFTENECCWMLIGLIFYILSVVDDLIFRCWEIVLILYTYHNFLWL